MISDAFILLCVQLLNGGSFKFNRNDFYTIATFVSELELQEQSPHLSQADFKIVFISL